MDNSNLIPAGDDNEEYDDPEGLLKLETGTPNRFRVTPDMQKGLTTAMATVVFTVALVMIVHVKPFGSDSDKATSERMAMMSAWQNASVDACENMYEYSCQKYDGQMAANMSIEQQRVNLLRSQLNKVDLPPMEYRPGVFYECVRLWNVNGVECVAPIGKPLADGIMVSSTPWTTGTPVYWMGGAISVSDWRRACNGSEFSEAAQWDELNKTAESVILERYYNVPWVYAEDDELESVFASIQRYAVEQLKKWGLEDEARTVAALKVEIYRGCNLSMGVGQCISESRPWTFVGSSDVVYVPEVGSVVVPLGAMIEPVYNVLWDVELKYVTIGHKIGRAIGASIDTESVEAIKRCMFSDGVFRDDFFLDYLSISFIMRGLYNEPSEHRMSFLTVLAQANCFSGPYQNETRVALTNTTFTLAPSFYATFSCMEPPIAKETRACFTR